MNKWQVRTRGYYRWEDIPEKPKYWYLQCEYRELDKNGKELFRSPHVNGYEEKP